MLIVIFHVGNDRFANLFGFIYEYGGFLGNYFFFILSGFLTVHAYRSRIAAGEISFASYISHKIIKWYPIYFITNLIVLIFNVHINHVEAFDLKSTILVFLMISNGWFTNIPCFNYPCWFICVLLLCNIIFYIAAWVYGKSRKGYGVFLSVILCWGLVLLLNDFSYPFMFNHDGEGIFNFFLGVILYHIFKEIEKMPRYVNIGIWVSSIVLLTICGASLIVGFENVLPDVRLLISLLLIPAILFIGIYAGVISNFLEKLSFLGNISLYLYFLHYPLSLIYDKTGMRVISKLGFGDAVQYLCLMLFIIVISTTVYYAKRKI